MGFGMSEGLTTESMGGRIKRLRLARGLSQRDIAGPGVSHAYVSRIEAGSRMPSVRALRWLARRLEVSVDYLETGRDLDQAGERELQMSDVELRLRLDQPTSDVEDEIEAILIEARQAGDSDIVSRGLVALGLAAARTGRTFQAAERLEAAIAAHPVSAPARPDVYSTLAQSYVALGVPDRAVATLERCLAETTEMVPDDLTMHVRYATYLSFALTDAGEYERARTLIKDTLRRAGPDPDPFTRVRLYWSLARLSGIEGRSAQALDYIRRAIALLEATEDTLDLARAYLMAAGVEATEGELVAARESCVRAQRLLGTSPEPVDLGMLRIVQARTAEDPREAIRFAREAVDLLGDYHGGEQGSAVLALAVAFGRQSDVTGAEAAYRRAVDLLSVHGRRAEAAEACLEWANLLDADGRGDEAEELRARAHGLEPAKRAAEA
jgi:transcriptional regulator with XRE-family HTH domain